MTVTKITCHYGTKRSQSYQSVEVSRTVEFTVGEDENRKEAIAKVHAALVESVNADADAALADALGASQGGR